MSLSAGDRLGPYEILSPVGAGGMGQVWKARDTRLDRIVAIKVSSEQFSERFEREARAVAALNHPHICHLYDVGPDYLVMEYVDGQPLKGPLPLDLVMKYAGQICDALDAAHKKNITHRDLKPANIMVAKSGIKLLDFGLAKLSSLTAADEATRTIALTQDNTILGTLQYMAPEQLEAKPADVRSDIFALGAVLYELVTGKLAFQGRSQASLISAIMTSTPPPVSEIQPAAPAALDRVIRTCLAKDPEERWQSARELKHALEWTQEPAAVAPMPSKRREWVGYALALCLAAALAVVYFRQADPQPGRRLLFTIPPPDNGAFTAASTPVISPDGTKIAVSARVSGSNAGLWIRSLDSLTWQPVPGIAGGTRPAWSPDGQSLVFTSQQTLQKIDLAGGSPQILCTVATYGAAWGRDGTILFSRTASPLYRVPAAGGPCVPATTLDTAHGEVGHYSPHFLPDGRHFLFLAQTRAGTWSQAIWVGSLDSKERVRLLASSSGPVYTGPDRGEGHLLFQTQGILMAQRFDPVGLHLSGEAVPVLGIPKVSAYHPNGTPAISASANGVLVHREVNESVELVWFDRGGKRLGTVARADAYSHFALSPDEKRVVYSGPDENTGVSNLWVADLTRDNARTRLTPGQVYGSVPVWSRDGSRVAYSSSDAGHWRIVQNAANGTGNVETLVESENWMIPSCWSVDGRFLVYHESDPKTGFDLWVLPLQGDRKPQVYLRTQFDERNGQISPDGRWMAYASNESGQLEVYVRTFPDPNGGKWAISVGGGAMPVWRRDGKELFFLSPDMKILSVQVTGGRAGFEAGRPVVLFSRPRPGLGYSNLGLDYAVTADGRRFLANAATDESGTSAITVLTNWTLGLTRK